MGRYREFHGFQVAPQRLGKLSQEPEMRSARRLDPGTQLVSVSPSQHGPIALSLAPSPNHLRPARLKSLRFSLPFVFEMSYYRCFLVLQTPFPGGGSHLKGGGAHRIEISPL
jgi:hypothetical protein